MQSFAVSYLKDWAKFHLDFFTIQGVETQFESQRIGSGNLRLEFSNYLVDVCVWDHACCLDIQIIHLPSEKVSYPTTGACETKEEFKSKLDELHAFVEKNSE